MIEILAAVGAAGLALWVVAPLLRRAASVGVSVDVAASPGGRRCPRCGPRPESDARYCSRCGARVAD